MAEAFAEHGDPSTAETEKFIRNFDHFFDCLNVRNKTEWKRKRKDGLKPYTSVDDVRLKVSFCAGCAWYCCDLIIILCTCIFLH